MGRHRLMVGALALFAALVAYVTLVQGGAARPERPVHEGDVRVAAPDIAIRTPKGEVRLSSHKGKVVLIDFWATWCGPCRASIPAIQKLYQDKRDQGFEVMGVALETGNDDSAIPGFVQEMGMTYPVGLATSNESIAPYNPSSIPTMYLIDRQGKVRWSQQGYGPSLDQIMSDEVDKLLAEK